MSSSTTVRSWRQLLVLAADAPGAAAAVQQEAADQCEQHDPAEHRDRHAADAVRRVVGARSAPRVGGVAVGLPDGLVDEVGQLAVGVAPGGALDLADQVAHRGVRHDLRVGAGVEPVAEPDGVDAGDADRGPQVLEHGPGRELRGGRQHGDEDRLVGLPDDVRQPADLGGAELAGGAGVHVDRSVPQGVRRVVDAARGVRGAARRTGRQGEAAQEAEQDCDQQQKGSFDQPPGTVPHEALLLDHCFIWLTITSPAEHSHNNG